MDKTSALKRAQEVKLEIMTDQQNDRQTDMRAHEAVSLLITMGFIKFFMWGFRGRKKKPNEFLHRPVVN